VKSSHLAAAEKSRSLLETSKYKMWRGYTDKCALNPLLIIGSPVAINKRTNLTNRIRALRELVVKKKLSLSNLLKQEKYLLKLGFIRERAEIRKQPLKICKIQILSRV
jgi:hypothetical protein